MTKHLSQPAQEILAILCKSDEPITAREIFEAGGGAAEQYGRSEGAHIRGIATELVARKYAISRSRTPEIKEYSVTALGRAIDGFKRLADLLKEIDVYTKILKEIDLYRKGELQ